MSPTKKELINNTNTDIEVETGANVVEMGDDDKTPLQSSRIRTRRSCICIGQEQRNFPWCATAAYIILVVASCGYMAFRIWEDTTQNRPHDPLNTTVTGEKSGSGINSGWTAPSQQYALSDEFIRKINEEASSWKAGRNFAEDMPLASIKKLMGVRRDQLMEGEKELLVDDKPTYVSGQPLPTEFDARTKWPQCKSISEIRDQGSCGSCWAFGAVETMTDRQCIHKNETFHYSAEDLISCCTGCGNGCDGGSPFSAFLYWKDVGIVSGGAYGSHQGCVPYEIENCEHHIDGDRKSCRGGIQTPFCKNRCDASYNNTYSHDLHFAKTVYTRDTEEEILQELASNGPLEGFFNVYEDFFHYKSGVYYPVAGWLVGGHAVKVLGFGVEEGLPYYLCANSWNYDWGNGGFFKIKRDRMFYSMVTGIPA